METWDRISQRGPGWYLLVGGLRNGDVYHVCSLARAFRQVHGHSLPLYLVIGSNQQAKLASLFAEDFDDVFMSSDFPRVKEEWATFFQIRTLPFFGPNVPIMVHPHFCFDENRASLDFAEKNGITWMQLYKQILHLPGGAVPAIPFVRPTVVDRAIVLCDENGIKPGKSVILFPHAQSLAVKALAHFERLAADLTADGYSMFTSVAQDELPVEGTTPVFIPFELLIDVAERAGWIVAVRSGICDITSSAACRKSYIYPNLAELYGWNMHAMGITRDAVEQPFDWTTRTPDDFSATIRGEIDFSPLAVRERRLSPFVGDGRDDVQVARRTFVMLRRDGPGSCPAPTAAAPTIVLDLPPRDHPRLAMQSARIIGDFMTNLPDAARCYCCGDEGLFDFFEEVSRPALAAGHYAFAGDWHNLVFSIEDLSDHLPSFVKQRVVRIAPFRRNRMTRLADSYFNAEHLAAANAPRPPTLGGVQLMKGWSTLEPDGVWTDHPASMIKMDVDEGVQPGDILRIVFGAAVSPAFPRVEFSLWINGEQVDRLDGGREAKTISVSLARSVGVSDLLVQFRFVDLKSPADQGFGGDQRLLGICLKQIGIGDAASVAPLADPSMAGR